MATPDTETPPAAAAAEASKPEDVKPEEPEASSKPVEEEAPAAAPAASATDEETVAVAPDVTDKGEPASLPSFKEESYYVKDLKESEKKSLAELSDKVEAAIKGNEFVLPPPVVEVVKEAVAVQTSEDVVVVAATVGTEVKQGEEVVSKQEDSVVAVAETGAAADASTTATPAEAATEPAKAEEVAEVSKPAVEEVAEAPKASTEGVVEEEAPKAAVTEEPKEAEASKDEGAAKVEEPKEEAAAAAPEESIVEETPKEEAAPPPPPEDLELQMWGVPLLPSKGDPRTQVIFIKFLRARDFKVKEAFTMLKNTILWRKKYGADKIVEEDLGTEFDGTAFNHGVDKEGHPVQYNVFSKLKDDALGERALRWRVQLLEKTIIESLDFSPGGVGSMLQVFDFKDAPMLSKKALRQFLLQAIVLMLDNYPELVVKIVFLNTPWYYSALYTFISPFLTQRTKSKLVFGSSLFKFISPDNIPVQYGGLSRVNDTEFGDGNVPVTELVLKAGEKQTAEIEVSSAGSTIVWDIVIVGTDVTYGAEFVPSKEGGYTTVVEKPKKITSVLEEPIRNSFKGTETGKLVLSVDNSASRKKKTVLYRYSVKTPELAAAAAE